MPPCVERSQAPSSSLCPFPIPETSGDISQAHTPHKPPPRVHVPAKSIQTRLKPLVSVWDPVEENKPLGLTMVMKAAMSPGKYVPESKESCCVER